MSLFSIFSNDDAEKAARQANAGLQQGYSDLSGLYGQGRDAINTGFGNAEGVLSTAVGKYGAGADAYGDATGANGPEGLARAQANFTNSGYSGVYGFTNDQAQQAIQRAHAAAGNPLSGNADTDAAKYAAGLASTTYGQFVNGLQPYLSGYGTATSNLGNAYTGQAGALNTSFDAQGNAANANQTAQGANTAGATLNNYKVGANQLNAALGVGNLLAGNPGGLTSSIGNSISNLFTTPTGANSYGAATSPYGSNPFTGNPNSPINTQAYSGGGGLFSAFS